MTLTLNFFGLNLVNPIVRSKFGGMYESFFAGLVKHKCQIIYSDQIPANNADILIVPMGGGQDYSSLWAMRRFAGPVVLYVPPANQWFDRQLLTRCRPKILFAYGTDASTLSPSLYSQIGISYFYFPFGSDPQVMKPLDIPRQYDVVFVGSLEHAPRRILFFESLMKQIGSRNLLCVGTGWQKYGIPNQLVTWGSLLNVIYNLGKVCVNVHTDTQILGQEKQLDLNNRVFDLAMAGCCQVCDNPDAVRFCFDDDEIVATNDPKEWAKRVIHLVDDSQSAERLRQKVFLRAHRDHMWSHRAKEFLGYILTRLPRWQPVSAAILQPSLGMLLTEVKRQTKRMIDWRA